MELIIGIVLGILWHIHDSKFAFDENIDWEKEKRLTLKGIKEEKSGEERGEKGIKGLGLFYIFQNNNKKVNLFFISFTSLYINTYQTKTKTSLSSSSYQTSSIKNKLRIGFLQIC